MLAYAWLLVLVTSTQFTCVRGAALTAHLLHAPCLGLDDALQRAMLHAQCHGMLCSTTLFSLLASQTPASSGNLNHPGPGPTLYACPTATNLHLTLFATSRTVTPIAPVRRAVTSNKLTAARGHGHVRVPCLGRPCLASQAPRPAGLRPGCAPSRPQTARGTRPLWPPAARSA